MQYITQHKTPLISAGATLILTSIVLGFIVEKTFIDWLKRINGWSTLIIVLLIGAALNTAILHRLQSQEIDLEEPEVADAAWQKTLDDISLMWQIHDSGLRLVPEQVMSFNTEMTKIMHNKGGWKAICPRRSTKMPTNAKFDLSDYGNEGMVYACHESVS